MDSAIAPGIEMVVDQKQTVSDVMTGGLKREKVGKNNKRGEDSEKATDAIPFHFCLKQSVEQQASPEIRISQALKKNNENSLEGMEVGNSLTSINNSIFPQVEYREAAFFQISNTVSADSEESKANGDPIGITTALSREVSTVAKSNDVDLILENQKTEMMSADSDFRDSSLFIEQTGRQNQSLPHEQVSTSNEQSPLSQNLNSQRSDEKGIFILEPTHMEFKGIENQKQEVMSSRTKTEMMNADSIIKNSSLSIEQKGHQSESLPHEEVSTSNEQAPLSQNLNSQRSDEKGIFILEPTHMEFKGIENQKQEVMSSRTKTEMMNADSVIKNSSLSIEQKGHQSESLPEEQVSTSSKQSPLSQNLNSQRSVNEMEQIKRSRLSGESVEQLQAGTFNTASDSQTDQSNKLNGKIDIRKEEFPASGNSGKGREDYFLNYKSDQKEGIRENLLSGQSVRKENQRVIRENNFNQDLNAVIENSNPGQLETGQLFSADNKTSGGKSGESKLIQPQVLMDQIIKAGTQIIQKGVGRVKMTLNPPNLGALDMEIQVKNNKVEIMFIADTPEIQQTLQANADLLKTALSQQGLKVDGYNVLIQGNLDPNPGSYSGEGALWRNSRGDGGNEGNRKDQEEMPGIIADMSTERHSDPVDQHRISLFI